MTNWALWHNLRYENDSIEDVEKLGKRTVIGTLALQGAFVEHVNTLERLGVDAYEVRTSDQLELIDGLIIPGGESTTVSKLMMAGDMMGKLRKLGQHGLPMMGTCAGMILLSSEVSDCNLDTLQLMDMKVRRNAFGRQVDSFETELTIPVIGEDPFRAIFIRAPVIEMMGCKVETLATLSDGTPVVARQEKLIAVAFHPELAQDDRLHKYFLDIVKHKK